MIHETIDVDRGELLAAMRYDCVSFLAFYLGDELTLEVPELHIEVWDELLRAIEQINQRQVNRVIKKLFAIPRGFAKSTIAKLGVILLLKYTYFRFVLYVSKTGANAKNAVRDILNWLQSQQETNLFGRTIIEKSSETEQLWIAQIAVRDPDSGQARMKRVIFKALGADQQVRGLNIFNMRPQIVVADDIEDNDNTTVELQPKLDTWFLGALFKALATEAYFLFIGNMIRKTTLLARLSKNPDWNPTVYGSIVLRNGEIQSLWEEKFPLANLLKEYADYRKLGQGHVWEAEMMNLTQEAILAKDLAGCVRPQLPLPEELTSGCLILDPAYGKDSEHDKSAITVHAQVRGIGIPVVLDSWLGKEEADQLLDELLRFSYYWGISTWFIESVAGQKLFIPLFELLLKERGIPPGVFTILPIASGGVAKPTRITSFRGIVQAGSYAIVDSQQELVDKLAAYDPGTIKHEDLEDSASYGTTVWQNYGDVIEQNGISTIAMKIMAAGGSAGGSIDSATTSAF